MAKIVINYLVLEKFGMDKIGFFTEQGQFDFVITEMGKKKIFTKKV